MKERLCILLSIIGLIEATCYFIPLCLMEEYWKFEQSTFYHGSARLERRSYINIFQSHDSMSKMLAIVLLFSVLLVVLVYLLMMLHYEILLCKHYSFVSLSHTLLMVIFLVYTCGFVRVEYVSYEYTYVIGLLFFAIIVMNAVSLIFVFCMKFVVVENNKVNSNKMNAKIKKMDELLKYKELLDMGCITQEDFNRKKEELNL